MEVDAAKAIGAGIACLGMGGVGIGLGNMFGSYLVTHQQLTANSVA